MATEPAQQELIEIAQSKRGEPKLPARPRSNPESTEKTAPDTIKSLSEALLKTEQSIANLDKEFQSLLSSGGANRQRADQFFGEITYATILEGTIERRTSVDQTFKDAGTQFLSAVEAVADKWAAYHGGPSYPAMNPLKWSAAGAHRKEVDEMRKSLNEVQKQFDTLKPYLLRWAEHLPAPSERLPDDGRPKFA